MQSFDQSNIINLSKICVMTSVNAMKLKLNPNLKVKLIESTIPYVPQIELY